MAVYMSSNSMKVISSQLWYLRSILCHDPAKLHSTICILKYITFIHFCGIFCVVVVWKGSGSSPGHWLSPLSSKYSSIGNDFGEKPSFLPLSLVSWRVGLFSIWRHFFCVIIWKGGNSSPRYSSSPSWSHCGDYLSLCGQLWRSDGKCGLQKRTRLMLMYIEL